MNYGGFGPPFFLLEVTYGRILVSTSNQRREMIIFGTSIYIDALIPTREKRNIDAKEIIRITTKRRFEIYENKYTV